MGLEKIRIELATQGVKAQIVIINDARANSPEDRKQLVDRTRLPIFQDTSFKSVWKTLAAKKDDMMIYDGSGKLVQTIPHGGDLPSKLETPEGYAAVKDALIKAATAAGEP